VKFLEFELDILSEIGNVTVGGAATSLSDFVQKMVTISLPSIKRTTFGQIKKDFETSALAAKIDFVDGFIGSNILLMRQSDADRFAKMVAKVKLGGMEQLDEVMKQSILTEVFNIMVGTMSSQMSIIFDRNVRIDTPSVYSKPGKEFTFYDDRTPLVTIGFEIKLEDGPSVHLYKLLTEEQAHEMVELIKEIHHI
jgi:flagellar motor switch protein FliN/FliY